MIPKIKIEDKIILLFLLLSNICYGQLHPVEKNNVKIVNININAGYSDISGYAGLNLDVKYVGFDVGISTVSWYDNNKFNRRCVVKSGITYYYKTINNHEYVSINPYMSIGYSYKSNYTTIDSLSILPAPIYNEIIWNDVFSIITGYSVSSVRSPISFKFGMGWNFPLSDNHPFAFDVVVKYRIFRKVYDNLIK
jgi:hypothetical protein